MLARKSDFVLAGLLELSRLQLYGRVDALEIVALELEFLRLLFQLRICLFQLGLLLLKASLRFFQRTILPRALRSIRGALRSGSAALPTGAEFPQAGLAAHFEGGGSHGDRGPLRTPVPEAFRTRVHGTQKANFDDGVNLPVHRAGKIARWRGLSRQAPNQKPDSRRHLSEDQRFPFRRALGPKPFA